MTISDLIDKLFDLDLNLTKDEGKAVFMLFNPGDVQLRKGTDNILYLTVKPLSAEFKIMEEINKK